jgi:flagellar motor switch protein FliN/FliY
MENKEIVEEIKNENGNVPEYEHPFTFLYDVELKAHGSVGTAKKLFRDILKMKEGDIIQLDKNVEDYLDLYINGELFAIGEIMIVNEKFSLRIVDIV